MVGVESKVGKTDANKFLHGRVGGLICYVQRRSVETPTFLP